MHHHEVGTAGQTEIDMRFDTLVNMADKVLMYKYIVKNVCYQNGYTATFMPKPLFGDNGSGMHTHQSLWKDGEPLFYDKDGYALLSDTCRWYIGGLLEARAGDPRLRRADHEQLSPPGARLRGADQPRLQRSATARLRPHPDLTRAARKARRLEFRAPDPIVQPVPLVLAPCSWPAWTASINKIEPPTPVDGDLYELDGERERQTARSRHLPASLTEVLDALEADHDFLLEGGVFTQDLIDSRSRTSASARWTRWPCGRIRTSSTSTTTSRSFPFCVSHVRSLTNPELAV